MSITRLILLTALAMLAFAGNSLLCRVALASSDIDAASFTSVRLLSGAMTLVLLVYAARRRWLPRGDWLSAVALFVYAASFSFAYLSLTAATGALLLFGAVQCTMIGWALGKGERLNWKQSLGVAVAVGGLIALLSPGLAAPPLAGAMLMIAAGIAWGVYSLRGRGAVDALGDTAGNFVRAVPFALLVSAVGIQVFKIEWWGAALAVASGALASGIGYAIWYQALPALRATTAATVQLSVPALAAAGGVGFLGEVITWRLALASLAILGGIAIYIASRNPTQRPDRRK